ncbi:PQQ-dependent sugar dehydrogenase [Mesorhizobium sp. NBSH29]|uniref:PQQ-dependent sugar dehydrogenase n=1 Tax=Mesorhizobium sp. NBSH29 TaxID=2654249 RepID=UPI0018969C8D|nr:PQQ-dependent sugar dehydrogenase [Mesorhizobium sp. NBSH29]QPC86596.1 PQQ-dependent sugar dehydrogenase [Mesorhizobium sp. NBSH29]
MLRRLALAVVAMLLTAIPASAQTSVETQAPNAPKQQPVFAGQTRAPLPASLTQPLVSVVAEGLPRLWGLEFLPGGAMLVTAKEGRMFIVSPEGKAGPDIAGVPAVDAGGQGGLLDVALAPDFEQSRRIFFSFAEPREGGNGTSVASATLALDADAPRLGDIRIVFRQTPTFAGRAHFGSRLVFAPDGSLYVTVGERSDTAVRGQAQDIASGLGKVFRIDQTGAALPDNPFIDVDGALPEIWSLGHRNLQSATLDGTGRLWTVEHGPRGGDELNRPQAGLNYGWPEVTYGIDYSGAPIGDGITRTAATEQPVYYWDPVIAPSGMAFYDGTMFASWKNAFLVGGLVAQSVVVLHMGGDRVVAEERVDVGARVRDVKVAPDGSVFAVTENGGGSQILRLSASAQ